MSTCIQVALHYMVTSIGLFIDQLTLGPLRDLAQYKSLYLASDIVMLVVSSTTEGDQYSLMKFISADCTLGVFGQWKVFLFGIPAYFTCRAGQPVERKANGELSYS